MVGTVGLVLCVWFRGAEAAAHLRRGLGGRVHQLAQPGGRSAGHERLHQGIPWQGRPRVGVRG
eukprot:11525291-Alexandrium_andersonii.AAC.2